MRTQRIKENSVKGLMIFSLFTFLSLKSCMVMAQSPSSVAQYNKYAKTNTKRSYTSNYHRYMGYELSVGFPSSKLTSDIPQLSNLQTQYLGVNVGGVMTNAFVKVKATGGYYYSTSAVPYEIDLIQGNVALNLYALRLNRTKPSWIEPYTVISLTQRQSKFYGFYLNQDPNINYSTSTIPLIGKNWQTYLNIGTGVEFQFTNDIHQLLQLFVEGGFGMRLDGSSKGDFANTKGTSQGYFTVGVNLSNLKH